MIQDIELFLDRWKAKREKYEAITFLIGYIQIYCAHVIFLFPALIGFVTSVYHDFLLQLNRDKYWRWTHGSTGAGFYSFHSFHKQLQGETKRTHVNSLLASFMIKEAA